MPSWANPFRKQSNPSFKFTSCSTLCFGSSGDAHSHGGRRYGAGKVSSPGEFHPQALAEPDVNLSIHPAPIVQPSLPSPRFRFTRTNPPLPGCSCGKTARRRPFGPVPLQNLQPYYERLRPCAPPRYSGACGGCPLARLPLHRGDRFLRSVPTPPSRSRRLHAGRRLSSEQVLLSTRFAEQSLGPGFDARYGPFDILSAVHLG